MAAVLRCATRRLGGSVLRPTQPAVPSRFMHSRHLSGEAGDISVPWAARSLGGSLLERCRTHAPAAVAEERRRLNLMPSSLIHSRGLSTKIPREDVLQAHRAQRLKELRESKEEERIKQEKELPKYIKWPLMVLGAILFAGFAYLYVTVWAIFYLFIFLSILG